MSEQRALTAKEANSILGCLHRRRGSRQRGGFIPLHSVPIRPHPAYRVQFCTPRPCQVQESWSMFSTGPPRWSGLEHLPCEERLRGGVLVQPGEETSLEGPNSSPPSTCGGVSKKTVPGSSQHSTLGGQGTMG